MNGSGTPAGIAGDLFHTLEVTLDDYTAEECIPIYAAMLQERHRLPKVRACIDYWQESFAQLRNGETGVTAGLNLLGMR